MKDVITLPRETVQQVLNTLNHVNQSDDDNDFMNLETSALVDDAITALRTALEAKTQDAYYPDGNGGYIKAGTYQAAPAAQQAEATRIEQIAGAISKHISTSLYQREVLAAAQYIYHRYCTQAAPAAREPLSDERIKAIAFNTRYHGIIDTCRAIEAAHGIGMEQK